MICQQPSTSAFVPMIDGICKLELLPPYRICYDTSYHMHIYVATVWIQYINSVRAEREERSLRRRHRHRRLDTNVRHRSRHHGLRQTHPRPSINHGASQALVQIQAATLLTVVLRLHGACGANIISYRHDDRLLCVCCLLSAQLFHILATFGRTLLLSAS